MVVRFRIFREASSALLFNPFFCEGSDFTEMVEFVGVWDGFSAHTVESFDSAVLHRPARWNDR